MAILRVMPCGPGCRVDPWRCPAGAWGACLGEATLGQLFRPLIAARPEEGHQPVCGPGYRDEVTGFFQPVEDAQLVEHLDHMECGCPLVASLCAADLALPRRPQA